MSIRTTALIAITTGILAGRAEAACEYLQRGLEGKMSEYRSYRERNLKRIEELQESKRGCDSRGSEVSLRASSVAAAESCTAQGEVAALDQTIEQLGRQCEEKYTELRDLQLHLKAAYKLAHDDLKGLLEMIGDDPLMAKYCGPEMDVAAKMGEAFLVLEGNIVGTLTSADQGAKSYAELKATGIALHARLEAGNKNCGGQPAAPGDPAGPSRMIASSHGQGSVAVVPIGNSPRPVSDISGTAKAIEANTKAEALIGSK